MDHLELVKAAAERKIAELSDTDTWTRDWLESSDAPFAEAWRREYGVELRTLRAVEEEPSEGLSAEQRAENRAEKLRALLYMNSMYRVLTQVGGKCRVLAWGKSDLGWPVPLLQSFEDFRNAHLHKRLELWVANDAGVVVRKSVPAANWWLTHSQRSEALSLCFSPETPEPIVEGCLNLWKGYGVEPRPGSWRMMQAFIRDIVASGNAEHAKYILDWCAWVLQNPGERAEVVLVLRGKRGVGKNTLLDALCKLLGAHAKAVSNPRHLLGNFNKHLQDCALLFANEAIPPHDKAAESILKALVTDITIAIERKGIDVEHVRNRLSICMASNEAWCVPAGLDERRFAVFDVSDERQQDTKYFAAIHAELNAGGYETMLEGLLARDLGSWHPRNDVPRTAALVEQQLDGLRGADRVVYQMLASGELLGAVNAKGGPKGHRFVATALLAEQSKKDPSQHTALGRALAQCCLPGAGQVSTRVKIGLDQRRGYWVPPLADARKHWATANGLDVAWDNAQDWAEGRFGG